VVDLIAAQQGVWYEALLGSKNLVEPDLLGNVSNIVVFEEVF
jgi:hypothetical protein